MLIIATSPSAVAPNNVPNSDFVQALLTSSRQFPVAVISNHGQPNWFAQNFAGSSVQFLTERGRQSGKIISENAARLGLAAHNSIIVAGGAADLQMAKNSGAIVITGGWAPAGHVQDIGIHAQTVIELTDILALTSQWQGQWWFSGDGPKYSVRALADLSGYGVDITQQAFGQKLTLAVKNGGSRLNALLTVAARSLLIDGLAAQKNLLWGVYPSSASQNNDSEVLSDFTHRLRTTVSRVHFAARGTPLFIRHTASIKRSGGSNINREDPSNQVETLCLNPEYSGGQLAGRHVIIVDDCTTYGLSFGVASAFLRAAGAAAVTGVALGKFGDRLLHYDIDIHANPFAPVPRGSYVFNGSMPFPGARSSDVQQQLHALIP